MSDYTFFFFCIDMILLLEKLAAHGLDGCTLHWIKNWLNGRAQRVVVNGVKFPYDRECFFDKCKK